MAKPMTFTPPNYARMDLLQRLEQQMATIQQSMSMLRQQMNAPVSIPMHHPPMYGMPPPQMMFPLSSPQIMNTTVPLHSGVQRGDAPQRQRFQTRRFVPNRDVNPRHHSKEDDAEISPYVLSDLLQESEEIVMRIIIGADADGYPKFATAHLQYDGSQLVVKSCETVPSLVDMKSDKAGALLYQFMDGLFDAGLLRRKFSIAPWKLCFVKRDGEFISLNKLRKQK